MASPEGCVDTTEIKAILALVLAVILAIGFFSGTISLMDTGKYEVCYLEIKYIVFNETDNSKHVEVVGKVWINGAPDYNNRPFKFPCGSKVKITAPETLDILDYKAYFAFWQKEEKEPTYQGLIVSNRTIEIVLNEKKQIWWANYVILSNDKIKGVNYDWCFDSLCGDP